MVFRDVPKSVVPVTHTFDLIQLAHEIAYALDLESILLVRLNLSCPSIYAASEFSYGAQLSRFGILPTCLAQQLREMSSGSIFHK